MRASYLDLHFGPLDPPSQRAISSLFVAQKMERYDGIRDHPWDR